MCVHDRNPSLLAASVVAALLAAAGVTACGGSSTVTIPDVTEKTEVVVEAPPWVADEFPMEESLFGHGRAPIVAGDETAATEAARADALKNLGMEMKILSNALTADHEEEIAEVISKYPLEEMVKNIQAVEETSLEKVEVVDTFTDSTMTPPRRHVLVKLPIEIYFEVLAAEESLPDAQKKRIADFKRTFIENVLTNLVRKP